MNLPSTLIANLLRYEIWHPIVALAYIRQLPDASYRAQALSNLAPHLTQTEERTQVLSEALSLTHQIQDTYSQAQALSNLAPRLAEIGQFQEALSIAREIENDIFIYRTQALSNLAPHLQKVSSNQFYSVWQAFWQACSALNRQDVLGVIKSLAQVFIERGSPETLSEVIQAIRDVERWWP